MMENNAKMQDREIEDMDYSKEMADILSRLGTSESEVSRSLKDLAKKIKKSNKELEEFLETQREISRLHIQLVNTKSDLISNTDQQRLKMQIQNLEKRTQMQTQLVNFIHQLASTYKDYSKEVNQLGKSAGKLYKEEFEWYNSTQNLTKAKYDQMVTGNRLEKIEKKIVKNKQSVLHAYEKRRHHDSLVSSGIESVNRILLQIKQAIKEIKW
ncbi:MAG: hypothetical protein ACTSVU_07875 [Promethearchaeota archaeon]